MQGVVDSAINILPAYSWEDVTPTRSCSDELRQNEHIRALVPLASSIADVCDMKVMEIPYADPPPPVQLPENELFAVVAYTHDTGTADKASNWYYQLNKQLRMRGATERMQMVKVWGTFVHYALKVHAPSSITYYWYTRRVLHMLPLPSLLNHGTYLIASHHIFRV
jgi:hypothetical protein